MQQAQPQQQAPPPQQAPPQQPQQDPAQMGYLQSMMSAMTPTQLQSLFTSVMGVSALSCSQALRPQCCTCSNQLQNVCAMASLMPSL